MIIYDSYLDQQVQFVKEVDDEVRSSDSRIRIYSICHCERSEAISQERI